MLDRIRKAVAADDETDTAWDGYLSTRAEWHAAAWGLCAAFIAAFTGEPYVFVTATGWILTRGSGRLPKELAKEAVYVAGHAVPGFLLGSGAAAVVALLP